MGAWPCTLGAQYYRRDQARVRDASRARPGVPTDAWGCARGTSTFGRSASSARVAAPVDTSGSAAVAEERTTPRSRVVTSAAAGATAETRVVSATAEAARVSTPAQKRVAAVCVVEQPRSPIDRQAVMMHHAGGQIRERVISAPRWPRLALWGTVFTELRDVDGGRVSAYRWCAVRRRGMVDHDVNASNRMICLRRAYNVNATLANP